MNDAAGVEGGRLRALGFRCAFIYWALYVLVSPSAWNLVVPWLSRRLLGPGAEIGFVFTGSGDTSFDWAVLILRATLAVVVGGLWSSFARGPLRRERLAAALRIGLRYWLALWMANYGVAKLMGGQFGPTEPFSLRQPVGEMSPMGLLWTFMGYSHAYTIFTGVVELLGALLLLLRRTTALGALIVVAAMTNVAMLNFCYDVPVKIDSIHYLVIALVLLRPDVGRLANLLVHNRPVEPSPIAPASPRRWVRRTRLTVRLVVTAAIVGAPVAQLASFASTSGTAVPPTGESLQGVWKVRAFAVNGRTRPPLATDGERWREVTVGPYADLQVRRMTDAWNRYEIDRAESRPGALTLAFYDRQQVLQKRTFTLGRPDTEHLVLDGTLEEGSSLHVELARIPAQDMTLTSRGFHWISERPFNR